MRPVDADALKDKLQQHHDFYVMAWGGFGKMPIGEKKRVDEITNCIAEVVNAPTIEPKRGEWMPIIEANEFGEVYQAGIYCSECGETLGCEANFCPNCGARMKGADDERADL